MSLLTGDDQFIERRRLFEDFLSSERRFGPEGERNYRDRIRQVLASGKPRMLVNVNDLREANSALATGLLQSPMEHLGPLQVALRYVAGTIASTINEDEQQQQSKIIDGSILLSAHELASKLHVGFEGSFGALHTTPRLLATRLLSHLVCLDGIITSCSLVRPKLVRSVHYSAERGAFLSRDYHDATMLDGVLGAPSFPATSMSSAPAINYPTSSDGSDRLVSEFGLSTYRDYQTVCMQEMPERSPAGQLPRTVDVVLEHDLVDSVKPGDRVRIIGVYKSLATLTGGAIVPSHFKAALVALSVRPLLAGASATGTLSSVSAHDERNMRTISRRRDVFSLLSRSLAPSIYGHEFVKKAVLLQLLGGVEKNLANGMHLRGDINVLLVGDPSTAKSQMLRFVLSLAPLAIATTGRGSSGVGLTAAVTTDRETGERRLEAGAMVLADRGIVCIDEFDKMSDADRVAIHEAMEQQTVTIAKAGIHASLNARCAVLAAANPIWGQYRETHSPQENIRLPDSLLSRFDLLFIVLDVNDPERDAAVSKHVLNMHRHIPAGLAEGEPICESGRRHVDDQVDEESSAAAGATSYGEDAHAVFSTQYGRASRRAVEKSMSDSSAQQDEDYEEEEDEEEEEEVLAVNFVKKYIAYARSRAAPVLTRAASQLITSAYVEFRQKREEMEEEAALAASHRQSNSNNGVITTSANTFPVTPRTLETLIRLATAHAKARLSSRVERRDAKVARELVEFCLYKEVKRRVKPSRKNRRAMTDESSSEEEDSDFELADDSERQSMFRNVLDASAAASGSSLDTAFASALDAASMPMDSSQMASNNLFVDPQSSSILSSQATTAADAAGKKADAASIRAVRTVLNQMRAASSMAVFSCALQDLQNKLQPAMPLDVLMAVLQEMADQNQVMISEDTIYII